MRVHAGNVAGLFGHSVGAIARTWHPASRMHPPSTCKIHHVNVASVQEQTASTTSLISPILPMGAILSELIGLGFSIEFDDPKQRCSHECHPWQLNCDARVPHANCLAIIVTATGTPAIGCPRGVDTLTRSAALLLQHPLTLTSVKRRESQQAS